MNIGQFGIVLIIGIFTLHANAGEQQEQDRSPMQAIASTQESEAIQMIRWRVAESCYRNIDCARRAASGANGLSMLSSKVSLGEPPSTPQRRRALGLLTDAE